MLEDAPRDGAQVRLHGASMRRHGCAGGFLPPTPNWRTAPVGVKPASRWVCPVVQQLRRIRVNQGIADENLFALNEVPGRLPKRISLQTVYRWATKGVNGIVLESIRVGGRKFTSSEAIQRFLRASNPVPQPRGAARPSPARERRLRERDVALSQERLARRLGVTAGEPNAPGGRWAPAEQPPTGGAGRKARQPRTRLNPPRTDRAVSPSIPDTTIPQEPSSGK